MKRDMLEIKRLVEVESAEEANSYLVKGKWVLVDSFIGTQLCYKTVTCSNNFEKIQPVDKIIRIYVLGELR